VSLFIFCFLRLCRRGISRAVDTLPAGISKMTSKTFCQ
jgi:hypothetical protein